VLFYCCDRLDNRNNSFFGFKIFHIDGVFGFFMPVQIYGSRRRERNRKEKKKTQISMSEFELIFSLNSFIKIHIFYFPYLFL
jgi:hypothetical protein